MVPPTTVQVVYLAILNAGGRIHALARCEIVVPQKPPDCNFSGEEHVHVLWALTVKNFVLNFKVVARKYIGVIVAVAAQVDAISSFCTEHNRVLFGSLAKRNFVLFDVVSPLKRDLVVTCKPDDQASLSHSSHLLKKFMAAYYVHHAVIFEQPCHSPRRTYSPNACAAEASHADSRSSP